MNLKLGEALINAGKLKAEQLEETLKEQAIFGGKLGTNLIEMGYLEEEELAEFLSSRTGIAHVDPDQLMNVSREVLSLIPAEVVAKYRVVPLSLNKRRLTLAMANPCDYAAIDEISFITGYIINPVLTTEVRLVCALEKHYNISRDRRSLRVNIQGRRRLVPSHLPPAEAKPAEAAATPWDQGWQLPVMENFSDPTAPTQYHHFEPPRQESQPAYPMETVLRELAEARSRQGIAGALLRYAAQFAEQVAIFLFKGDTVMGWMARSKGTPVQGFETVKISLGDSPLFRRVVESKRCYLGPLTDPAALGTIRGALGPDLQEHALLLPLLMTGKVVGVIYLESDGTRQSGATASELHKLLGKASLAFEILVLKSKILMT